MTERILVFKGDKVVYDSYYEEILCVSEDDCIIIKDVPPDQILKECAIVKVFLCDYILVKGRELWSDGEKWIIKG